MIRHKRGALCVRRVHLVRPRRLSHPGEAGDSGNAGTAHASEGDWFITPATPEGAAAVMASPRPTLICASKPSDVARAR